MDGSCVAGRFGQRRRVVSPFGFAKEMRWVLGGIAALVMRDGARGCRRRRIVGNC